MKEDSSDSDQKTSNFNRQQNPTKLKLPTKLTATDLDAIKTKKIKTDSFSEMCDRILQQNQKLREDQFEDIAISPKDQDDDVVIYDRHYHKGIIEKYRQTTEQDKNRYGLADEGKCQQFCLNNKFLVVIVGRLPISYSNGTSISLYLPKSMLDAPTKKFGDLEIVIIKRRGNQNDTNFLNYAYLIVEPEILLYPSYICSWVECKRHITLSNYVGRQFQVNQNMVFGSACHRYMEWLIDNQVPAQNKSYNEFKDIIRKIYQSFLYDMYLIGATFQDFWRYCEPSLTNIRIWVNNYVVNKRQIQVNKYQKLYLVIDQTIGSQMTFRSKYFGLKGKIDSLFKGRLINKANNSKTQVYIPFELKTGKKSSQSHKRQIQIYNMLLRQQFKKPVLGLLYYSDGNSTIFRNQSSEVAFQTLVIHRNTIIINLNRLFKTEKITLPSFTSNMDSCKICRTSTICESFHICGKLQEQKSNKYKNKYSQSTAESKSKQHFLPQIQNNKNNENASSVIESILDSESQHEIEEKTPSSMNTTAKTNIQALSPPQVSYLLKWMKWLHYQELQTKNSIQKNLKSGFNNFTLKFDQLQKIKKHFLLKQEFKLKLTIEKQMKTFEQLNQICNYYQASQKMRMLVNHIGIMECCKIIKTKKKGRVFSIQIQMNNKQISVYKRILQFSINNKMDQNVDLQKFQSQGFASLRNVIFNFILGPNQRLKQMVLENYQPKIQLPKQNAAKPNNVISQSPEQNHAEQQQKIEIPIIISKQDLQGLNENQSEAFRKVFAQNSRCTLIQGMPGTGKTELIVKLIEKSYFLNWRVLITTYTNRSLDNILERMIEYKKIPDQKVIRQGSRYSIDQRYEKFNSRNQKFQSIDDYRQYFEEKRFWFVTLASMSIHHIPEKFDLVILDEASQSLEPACLQALSKGGKLVLIGDYKQLQPIVKSKQADKEGMSTSLFQKLCYRYSSQTVSLKLQYRMNKQIMKISNSLVYDGQLQAGSKSVENKILHLCSDWQNFCGQQTLKEIISPQQSIIYLNHDGITSALNPKHRSHSQQIAHVLQVYISLYLFKKFTQLGVGADKISIVCVYNKTVDAIVNRLKKRYGSKNRSSKGQKSTEKESQNHFDKNYGKILTIDKSQGIDKEIIILLVESGNNSTKNNFLLQDKRRLNVALTRAKTKLIVIGSFKFISSLSVFNGELSEILKGSQLTITKSLIDLILTQVNDLKSDQSEKQQEQIQELQ